MTTTECVGGLLPFFFGEEDFFFDDGDGVDFVTLMQLPSAAARDQPGAEEIDDEDCADADSVGSGDN